jgi:hypothetical protein
MRRYPADPEGRPDLPYNLIFVEDGAAATRRRGATAAATRSSGAAAASDTGANVGPDSHVSFLSVLRLMRSHPAGPPGPAETFLRLKGVDLAAAAAGHGSATAAATRRSDDASANVGPDLHGSFLSCFALDCAVSADPRAGRTLSYGLESVGSAAAATGRTAATGHRSAAIDGADLVIDSAKSGATSGPDFHVTSFHVLRRMRVIPQTVSPTEPLSELPRCSLHLR